MRSWVKYAAYLGVYDMARETRYEPFVKVMSRLACNFLWNLDELSDSRECERFFSCPLQVVLFPELNSTGGRRYH